MRKLARPVDRVGRGRSQVLRASDAHGQRGAALLIVLSLLTVLLLLAMAFSYTSVMDRMTSEANADLVGARVLAESGIERVMGFLRNGYFNDVYPGDTFYRPSPDSAWAGRAYMPSINGSDRTGIEQALGLSFEGLSYCPEAPLHANTGWIPIQSSRRIGGVDKEVIIGRLAYVVIDESGKLDPGAVVSNGGEEEDETPGSGAMHERTGASVAEISLDDAGIADADRFRPKTVAGGTAGEMPDDGRWYSPRHMAAALKADQGMFDQITRLLYPFSKDEETFWRDANGDGAWADGEDEERVDITGTLVLTDLYNLFVGPDPANVMDDAEWLSETTRSPWFRARIGLLGLSEVEGRQYVAAQIAANLVDYADTDSIPTPAYVDASGNIQAGSHSGSINVYGVERTWGISEVAMRVRAEVHPPGAQNPNIPPESSIWPALPPDTVWGIGDSSSKLCYYVLSGGTVENVEGDIDGIAGPKDVEAFTVSEAGVMYFMNNVATSKLYMILPHELDLDKDTDVNAIYVGDTGLSAGPTNEEITGLQFVNGVLYGISKGTKAVYRINTGDGSVDRVSTLDYTPAFTAGALALGSDGFVYLARANATNSEIWRFAAFPYGDIQKVLTVAGSKRIDCLTAHPNGFLYAADDQKWYEIDPVAATSSVLLTLSTDLKGMDFNYYAETGPHGGAVPPPAVGSYHITGNININPGNATQHYFTAETPTGDITRTLLLDQGAGYEYNGPCTMLFFRPKAQGRTLVINGVAFTLAVNTSYTIRSNSMNVHIYNKHPGEKSNMKAMGHWWIEIDADMASIDPDPSTHLSFKPGFKGEVFFPWATGATGTDPHGQLTVGYSVTVETSGHKSKTASGTLTVPLDSTVDIDGGTLSFSADYVEPANWTVVTTSLGATETYRISEARIDSVVLSDGSGGVIDQLPPAGSTAPCFARWEQLGSSRMSNVFYAAAEAFDALFNDWVATDSTCAQIWNARPGTDFLSEGAGYSVADIGNLRYGGYASAPYCGVDVANQPFSRVGEIGRLHTFMPQRSIRLWNAREEDMIGNDADVLDLFKATPDRITHGKVNINTRNMPVLRALFANAVNVDLADAVQAVMLRRQSGEKFTSIGDLFKVAGLTGTNPAMDAAEEAAVERLAELVTVRPNYFTVLITAQAIHDVEGIRYDSDGDGARDTAASLNRLDFARDATGNAKMMDRLLAEQKVMAVLRRDAITNRFRVEQFEFID